ncbi:MAG: hypothetical protein ACK4MF_10345 [Hyphomicrobiaceae bacterium]
MLALTFVALAALSSLALAAGDGIEAHPFEAAMPLIGFAGKAALAPAGTGSESAALYSFSDADAPAKPYWCNSTGALVDNIERLGGESVMRVDLDDGRRLERYWNASEEVTIEHGTDGTSCLVELRHRSGR